MPSSISTYFGMPLVNLPTLENSRRPSTGNSPDQGLDRGDAIVERRLRIVEGVAPAAGHDGPVAHLIAAEDQSGHAPGVEHQHAARRQQQMIDVDEAAHAVGHQHLMRRFVGDALQAREQRLAPGAAPVGAESHVAAGADQQQRRAGRDPLRFDSNVVHSSAAATAVSVGGKSR